MNLDFVPSLLLKKGLILKIDALNPMKNQFRNKSL